MPLETYRMTIQGIGSGEQCQNIHHFICDNDDDGAPRSIAGELLTWWIANAKIFWLTFNSNRYALRYIEAKRILPSGGNSYWIEFPGGTEFGAVNAEQAPLQTSPIAKLFGGLSMGLQGRNFLPSPPETSLVANVLQTTFRDNVIEYYDELISFSGTSHDFWLAIYSKKTNSSEIVTTVSISDIIGMRRQRAEPL